MTIAQLWLSVLTLFLTSTATDDLVEEKDYNAVKQKLRASSPNTFSPAAVSKNDLKLITEGKTFHWHEK